VTAAHPGARYEAEDLLWVRDALGTSHVELDPWGNLTVSPATAPHEWAVWALVRLLTLGLEGTGASVHAGWGWRVAGGSGYLNVPDVLVLAADCTPTDDDGLTVPPLLVVEVASPTTRANDRDRKADDYQRGLAEAYLLADLPGLAPVEEPTIEVRRPGQAATIHTAPTTVGVGGRVLGLDPAALVRPGA